MNRRETIKSLLIGSVAAGIALKGCAPNTIENGPDIIDVPLYGRTEKEKQRDQELFTEEFLNKHELETIAVLCDIILPANDNFGSATDAGVDEFIDFIVKDMPYHQTPIRGGLMWLDNLTNKLYKKEFMRCTNEEQQEICKQIAFPGKTKQEFMQGEKFFTRMRNLTLTGYYTTKMGIDDLGYKGNIPNVWDGVPEDILKEHNLSYDKDWLPKFVDQSKRGEVAEWDDKGKLIS